MFHYPHSAKTIIFSIAFTSFALFWVGCVISSTAAATQTATSSFPCDFTKAIETDGHRKLALIVGVGEYKNDDIPDLVGPPNDAQRIYNLLTAKNGYGFPRKNVCLLLNNEATTAAFTTAFQKGLIARARKDDVAVIFYAGHGSQRRDRNHDEPDGKDETFLFHDARTADVGDFIDDKLNHLLENLYQKTTNITVILDSCNAGTATRAAAESSVVARFFKPAAEMGGQPEEFTDGQGDGEAGWVPAVMPGLVALTAASDGTAALEKDGGGIFTDALLSVLSQSTDQPLTYAQVARQLPPIVAAQSYQIPYFQGHLDKPIFNSKARPRALAWEVINVGPPIEIGGPPLPGIGKGAELRIYDGAISGAAMRDPGKAKATVVIDKATSINATVHMSAVKRGAPKLKVGDLALLARPMDDYLGIRVGMRPQNRITSNREASMLVTISNSKADFELSIDNNDRLVLRGPENRIRIVYEDDKAVAGNLWQHARQRAMLQLRGEGGSDFTDNKTLQVQLVPAKKQTACAKGAWEQAEPNTHQVVPLCHRWHIKVKLVEESPYPLLIGGIIFSADGSMFGLPADGRTVLLKPGESVTFNHAAETFAGQLPLDTNDHIMLFGTQETNPVRWHQLTQVAKTRATHTMSGLNKTLHRYLMKPGTRGIGLEAEPLEDTTWTLSSITGQVKANQQFFQVDKTSPRAIDKREFTIANFNIAPYLPDDRNSALYKVLQKSDWLVNASITDGFGYKQHNWSKASDEENLQHGIDCSRFMWFAFTRTGLPYNKTNRYLTTAMMVSPQSSMKDEFERCDTDDLQTGDLVVYRDKRPQHPTGHVVMVIDPDKRIAVGSHGWDGNAPQLKIKQDVGAEYQLIKSQQDWRRWDRPDMEIKACWRYRTFIEEAESGRGKPGIQALKEVCNARKQCGVSGSP